MTQRFDGRTAIITAAEGGTVCIFDIDPVNLEKSAFELQVNPFRVDASVESEVAAGVQRVVEQYGRLDILVHCAGIVGPTSTNLIDYRPEDFDRVLHVNLYSAYYLTRQAVRPMLEQRYGRILLVSSMAGKEGNPGMVGYATSKAGIIGLVKAVGKEYADSGVTVNGLAPAVIRTPMNERTSPEQLRYLIERIPMKRLGTVEEASALACWIVSEEASFNTGFIFDLSGGRATY
jgi:NAD(P)-dependent dehydrogenase (short-subunit alcohol dehydrogenase family)